MIHRFEIEGHSDLKPHGEDILCAAVSAISQTTIGALGDLTAAKVNYRIDEQRGYTSCEITNFAKLSSEEQAKADILMQAARIGLKQIEIAYPATLKIKDKLYREDRK